VKPSAVDIAVRLALQGGSAPGRGEAVVVALSGGADSVALLDALASAAPVHGLRLVAAHLDHRLRPGSRDDARFCASLCARLGVPLRAGGAPVAARAAREGAGLEAAARRARYAFLRAVSRDQGATAIAVAHTLDDQAETVLLRLLRGAGARGLGAMAPRRGDLWRPLLGVTRAEILRHLRARGLDWREDPSNADLTHRRNRVRHELLPYLESRFNPDVRRAIARTAALLRDEDALLAARARRVPLRREDGAAVLSRAVLRKLPRALARRVVRRGLRAAGGLQGVGHAHVERVLDLALAPASGRRLALPGAREAGAEFDVLRLGPPARVPPPFTRELTVPGRVALPEGGVLVAEAAAGPAGGDGRSAVVRAPRGRLTVRTRRPGDRVRSGRVKKSLKRFLIERRVPASRRAGLALVAVGHDVLWVPGQRPPRAAGEGGGGFVRLRVERERKVGER
jgi:tRNA(Ile)-lysidine synthase